MNWLYDIFNWLYLLPMCLGMCLASILNFSGRDWKTCLSAVIYSLTPVLNIYFFSIFIYGLLFRESE